jgi:putative membrane protein
MSLICGDFMSDRNPGIILWLLVVLTAALSIFAVLPFTVGIAGILGIICTLARLLFALIHGSHQLGWHRLGILFVITCIVSWCYESLSIATGFPFGHYEYTAELGPKLGAVPVMIMPAYFGVCYLAWVLAHILLDKFDRQIDSRSMFAIPVIASFIMVMWDMSIDPLSSTVMHQWIWHDGGSYFGVPFSNFLGWLLCVYTVFQLWAIYLMRSKQIKNCPSESSKSWWYLPVAFYGAIFLGSISGVVFAPNGTITDASSQVWPLKALYETLGLVSIFTMLFVTCLAFFKVQKNDNLR